MFLDSFPPSSTLKDIVACYMHIESGPGAAQWQKDVQMPAGLTCIGFTYGERTKYKAGVGEVRSIPTCAILGQHDVPYTILYKSYRKEFLVILKPAGLYQLLRSNIGELKNEMTDASAAMLPGADAIGDQLSCAAGVHQKIAIVENWLLKILSRTFSKTGLTDYILENILLRKGILSISKLAEELKINKKQIERLLIEQLGLSPKKFAEIVRFNYLNQLLLNNPSLAMTDLVYLGDFYDQAHLIKHIAKITGVSPGKYIDFLQATEIARFNHRHSVAVEKT